MNLGCPIESLYTTKVHKKLRLKRNPPNNMNHFVYVGKFKSTRRDGAW